MRRINNYTLYVEDIDSYVQYCTREYRLNEPPQVRVLENGIILPQKRDRGGVCDAEANFCAGHKRCDRDDPFIWKGICAAYPVSSHEMTHIHETVVYGGLIFDHYGHVISEGLSRMWWFLENPDSGYKFAFISKWAPISETGKIKFVDFYRMLGLREEDIILIKEPTRFDSIIVPEQSSYPHIGFTDKDVSVYNAIRDSVTPAGYEKVYLTRTKLVPKHIINEEYFEEYYRSLGYEVIAPEQLSIRDQVAVMAGAKEIACVSGTLCHQILFCHDGIKITILPKTTDILWSQMPINEKRKANVYYVDVSINFLPNRVWGKYVHLFAPTLYWRQYILDQYNDTEVENAHSLSIRESVFEYITQWTKNICTQSQDILLGLRHRHVELIDFIIGVHKYLLGEELDEPTKKRLREVFDRHEKLNKKLNKKTKEFDELQQRYKRLKSSLSWKLTAPVRAIGRLLGLPKKRKNT
jgi:hypothetical protein